MGGENDIKILVAGGPVGDEGDWVMSEIVPDPSEVVESFDQAFRYDSPERWDFVGEISKQLDFVPEGYGRHCAGLQNKLVKQTAQGFGARFGERDCLIGLYVRIVRRREKHFALEAV